MILGPFTTLKSTFLITFHDGYLFLIKLNLKSSVKYAFSKTGLPLFSHHIEKLKEQPLNELFANHEIEKIDLKSDVEFELIKNLLVDTQLKFKLKKKEVRLTPDLGLSDDEIKYLSYVLGSKMKDNRNESYS